MAARGERFDLRPSRICAASVLVRFLSPWRGSPEEGRRRWVRLPRSSKGGGASTGFDSRTAFRFSTPNARRNHTHDCDQLRGIHSCNGDEAPQAPMCVAASKQFPLLMVGESGRGGIPTLVGQFSHSRSPGQSERARGGDRASNGKCRGDH